MTHSTIRVDHLTINYYGPPGAQAGLDALVAAAAKQTAAPAPLQSSVELASDTSPAQAHQMDEPAEPSAPAPVEHSTQSQPLAELELPSIGDLWPGQGGIYAGVRQYPEGLCHLIVAAADAGSHAWGAREAETMAISLTDGVINTLELAVNGPYSPAVDAARLHTADGHQNFYLPAIAELHHAWASIPEAFINDSYWSSSERSAKGAFRIDFAAGVQLGSTKDTAHLVRPVRRFTA